MNVSPVSPEELARALGVRIGDIAADAAVARMTERLAAAQEPALVTKPAVVHRDTKPELADAVHERLGGTSGGTSAEGVLSMLEEDEIPASLDDVKVALRSLVDAGRASNDPRWPNNYVYRDPTLETLGEAVLRVLRVDKGLGDVEGVRKAIGKTTHSVNTVLTVLLGFEALGKAHCAAGGWKLGPAPANAATKPMAKAAKATPKPAPVKRARTSPKAQADLEARVVQIVLCSADPLSAGDVATRGGIAPTAAGNALRKLSKAGTIAVEGEKRNARYSRPVTRAATKSVLDEAIEEDVGTDAAEAAE